MQQVGTIQQIWRYPVKGMAGQRLQEGELTERGVTGDRTWALRDTARQEIQSCKTRPDLLRCVAEQVEGAADDAGVAITLPDGRVMRSGDDGIHEALSELTGHASTLECLAADRPDDFTTGTTAASLAGGRNWKPLLNAPPASPCPISLTTSRKPPCGTSPPPEASSSWPRCTW